MRGKVAGQINNELKLTMKVCKAKGLAGSCHNYLCVHLYELPDEGLRSMDRDNV